VTPSTSRLVALYDLTRRELAGHLVNTSLPRASRALALSTVNRLRTSLR
jgi:hypothetical protein